jgi:TolA-binding protein
MEGFKGITQETADDMLKAFQEFNESAEVFRAAFDASLEVYMNECQQAAAMKFVEYMHKYVDGTFLTRWYWLRKARKCNETLKVIIQLNEEYLNINSHVASKDRRAKEEGA